MVTGGATGIGFGITRVLCGYGARVAGARLFLGDVSEPEGWFREVLESYGAVDGLVNNAAVTGVAAIAPFLEASRAHIDSMLVVNLKGPVLCSQLAARADTTPELPDLG